MKLFKTLLLAGLAFTAVNAGAQTADEIVAKNIEAMGGAAKLATLNSVKTTGTMSVQGTDVAITTTKLNNKGMRLDVEVMGTSNYQIINAQKGYTFFPIQGMTDPLEMDAEQYKSAASQLDVQGALYNYKAKGTTVEYLGTEKVDGADAYKLKLTYKSGKVSNYFIDTKTNRLVKSTTKATVNGEEMELENTYSDYKQDANGFWFPYSGTNPQGSLSIDKVETNITVDEAIFKG